MIRFYRLVDLSSPANRQRLAEVQRIYERAFPYYPQYAAKIRKWMKDAVREKFEVILILAEGRKGRVLGFSLCFYYPDIKYGYLDYIAIEPDRSARGIGGALYEVTREALQLRKAKGLCCDVPPDERGMLKEPERLAINRRRLAFYERFGARPIIGTLYDQLETPANQGFLTFLVYDPLGQDRPLRRTELRRLIKRLFETKYAMSAEDARVRKIIASVKDDPVQIRAPRYRTPELKLPSQRLGKLDVVAVGNEHQIHHLKERGYVERPARMDAIVRGLQVLSPIWHKPRECSAKLVREVHATDLVRFLKQAETKLKPNELLYPNVFPIRLAERRPKTWEMQAGYYCIDTFTPLTSEVYRAALRSVHSAVTGAELLLNGAQTVYSLARPPGHHAEKKVFGGFCYLNNAAIAAHRLSKNGRVAFLDIDYHHGNGSQNIFYERADVFFLSIHGHPRQAYPYFAGFADETGMGEGKGFNRNFPLNPGADDARYLKTLDAAIEVIRGYRPYCMVISLGFDTMRGDPTGTFLLTLKGIEEVGARLGKLGLPTLVVQEGGYSLANLRQGATRFFIGMAKERS